LSASPIADLLAVCLPEGGSEPLYRRLYQALREAILAGRLHHRLPASRRLAADLGISRNTVAAAYEQLMAEGYLTTRVGAGTFVAVDFPRAVSPAGGSAGKRPVPGLPPAGSRQPPGPLRTSYPLAPFHTGYRDDEDFPWAVWSRLLARPWRRPTQALASRPDPRGLPSLRTEIAQMLGASRAASCHPDQILIVNGAQQALDLAFRLLLKPGDKVLVEDPGYSGTDAAARAGGGVIVPQAVDEEGLVPPEVWDGLKAVVVTPSRNFPLGTILSLSRRLALLQAARAARCWIIEDDYDADFRFKGRPLAALFGLDHDERVLYAGTFTRTMFPGLRLGYLVVPRSLAEAALEVRQAMDGGPATPHQAALALFMAEGHYASRIRILRRRYGERAALFRSLLDRRLGERLSVLPADGGLHLTALLTPLPSGGPADDLALCQDLAGGGVAARPLSAFYRGSVRQSGLVLGFRGWPDASLSPAVERMAAILGW
jgi:GntR family transcriptional regulator/MocR family aminotransferase